MDKASDFESEDCRFESCHDQKSFFLSFKAIQKEACSVLIREMEEKRDKTRKTHKNKTEKIKQMTLFQNLSNANCWLAYTTFLLNNNAREKTRLKIIWLLPGRGVLERVLAVGFCQEMAVVAAISQVKDCYKILKHIILPMYTN